MTSEKSTIMVLKVDLECSCCYKKVKKVLCEFPREIRDQQFDEKKNTVTITVVCCSPEKFRDKLCCKGGKAIISIEIKESQPPKPPTKPPVKPPTVIEEKPKVCNVVATIKLPEPVNGCSPHAFPFMPCCGQCYHGYGGGPCHHGFGRPVPPFPSMPCCGRCRDGYGGCPCHQGLGRQVPPPPGPCYDGYGYGGNRACYAVSRCDYFNEENPSGC